MTDDACLSFYEQNASFSFWLPIIATNHRLFFYVAATKLPTHSFVLTFFCSRMKVVHSEVVQAFALIVNICVPILLLILFHCVKALFIVMSFIASKAFRHLFETVGSVASLFKTNKKDKKHRNFFTLPVNFCGVVRDNLFCIHIHGLVTNIIKGMKEDLTKEQFRIMFFFELMSFLFFSLFLLLHL